MNLNNKDLSITAILLIWLYVCGSLYLIGYWTTFNFNVANFVNLIDIPKAFLLPIASNSLETFFTIISGSITPIILELFTTISSTSIISTKFKFISVAVLLFIGYNVIQLLFYDLQYDNESFWILFYSVILGLSSYLVIYLSNKFGKPKKSITSLLILFVSIIPNCSFFTGKLSSLNISLKKNYQIISYVKTKDNNLDSIKLINKKLIGFIGDKIIIATVDNDSITVINQSDISSISFITFKEVKTVIKDSTIINYKKL